MPTSLREEDLSSLLSDLPPDARPVIIDALSSQGMAAGEMLETVAKLRKGRISSVVVTTLALADALSAIGARMLAHRKIGPAADEDAAAVAFDVAPEPDGLVAAGIATKGAQLTEGDVPEGARVQRGRLLTEAELITLGQRALAEHDIAALLELGEAVGRAPGTHREDHQHARVETTKTRHLRLVKEDEAEERTVLGVVLEPNIVDSHGDTYSVEEIRQAAFGFVEFFQEFKLQHESPLADGSVRLLESYLLPVACEIAGVALPVGTWLMRVRVVDDALWSAIRKGTLTAFSMGGSAIRRQLSPDELAQRADRADTESQAEAA